jgi:hypothetical protein
MHLPQSATIYKNLQGFTRFCKDLKEVAYGMAPSLKRLSEAKQTASDHSLAQRGESITRSHAHPYFGFHNNSGMSPRVPVSSKGLRGQPTNPGDLGSAGLVGWGPSAPPGIYDFAVQNELFWFVELTKDNMFA